MITLAFVMITYGSLYTKQNGRISFGQLFTIQFLCFYSSFLCLFALSPLSSFYWLSLSQDVCPCCALGRSWPYPGSALWQQHRNNNLVAAAYVISLISIIWIYPTAWKWLSKSPDLSGKDNLNYLKHQNDHLDQFVHGNLGVDSLLHQQHWHGYLGTWHKIYNGCDLRCFRQLLEHLNKHSM